MELTLPEAELSELEDLLGQPVAAGSVVPIFGSTDSESEWKRVAYEICLPHNVEAMVTSTAPADPGSVVLRGGTGQTLEGFEQIGGTVTRVTAVHRPLDGPGQGVITVSDQPQEAVFLSATDDGTPRNFAAFTVPEGRLMQLRLEVADMSIALDGAGYPVAVAGGTESGFKIVFPGGGVLISEEEHTSVAFDFDLTTSLLHNRGRGFVLNPVAGTGAVAVPPTPYDDLDLFEEQYDIVLLRDRLFSFEVDEEEVQDQVEFVPALFRPGVRFSSWTGDPIFLGALRAGVSVEVIAGEPLWLGVIYDPGDDGEGSYIFVDTNGATVAEVNTGVLDPGGPWDPVIIGRPADESGELDPIAYVDFEEPSFTHVPKADWPDFGFDSPDETGAQTIPQVISLVHGRTGRPGVQPYESIGTSAHAFHYWGFDFIAELLGAPGAGRLGTFDVSMDDATMIAREVWRQGGYSRQTLKAIHESEQWIRDARVTLAGLNLAAAINWVICALSCGPPCWAACFVASVLATSAYAVGKELNKELTRLDELREDKVRLGNFLFHPASPERVVMLTYRDGSRALAEQSSFLIQQVAVFYQNLLDNWFDPELHENPPLYFVSHSMGGLVLRHLLTAPHGDVGGPALSDSAIMHAGEISKRTVALITIQTPHEGSPAAPLAKELAEAIRAYEELLWVMRPLQIAIIHVLIGSPTVLVDRATGARLPATAHLEEQFWADLNSAELAPHNLRRPDGSLIPVYPILGRTPSVGRFNDPAWSEDKRLLEELASLPAVGTVSATILKLFAASRVREELESVENEFGRKVRTDTLGLMIADGFLNREVGGWGDAVAADGSVDLMRRQAMPHATVGQVFPHLYLFPDHGHEQDNDGLVPSVSALGVRLGTQTSDYFCHSQIWSIGDEEMRGSWYRTYTTNRDWDWSNHSSILRDPNAARWLRDTLLHQNVAGPYVGPGDVSQWWPE